MFSAWKKRVEISLEREFGRDSIELRAFKDIKFASPYLLGSGIIVEGRDVQYAYGLEEDKSLLNSYVKRLESEGRNGPNQAILRQKLRTMDKNLESHEDDYFKKIKHDLLNTSSADKFEERVEELLFMLGIEGFRIARGEAKGFDIVALSHETGYQIPLIIACTIGRVTENDAIKLGEAQKTVCDRLREKLGIPCNTCLKMVFSNNEDVDNGAIKVARQDSERLFILARRELENLFEDLIKNEENIRHNHKNFIYRLKLRAR